MISGAGGFGHRPPPTRGGSDLKVLELYAGIGGCAAALDGSAAAIVAAVDQSRVALAAYGANFPDHPRIARRVDDLEARTLAAFGADLWWASPPCQPFTVRGRRRDLDDPRAATFVALVQRIEAVRPRWLVLENVVGFRSSRAHARLLQALDGYREVRELVLCPSSLGRPNRRPRIYLLAARDEPLGPAPRPPRRRPLGDHLDPFPDPSLRLADDLVERYRGALHGVDAADEHAVTTCFTAAYGRSPVRSGSYLRLGDGGLRRFSPAEVLRLLGFPASFRLPEPLSRRKRWHLAGNSLSVPAVRSVLEQIPALRGRLAPPAVAAAGGCVDRRSPLASQSQDGEGDPCAS